MESTAIVYIRVASGGQSTNEVIWQQYEAVCRYCEQQGYRIVDVVRNVGGGKDANRYLSEAASKAKKLKADRIVAMGWSRFTRDVPYLLRMEKRLAKRNIRMETSDASCGAMLFPQILKQRYNSCVNIRNRREL